jgi:radical SAM protein with 4Fe4S-binding SPASM domain
LNLEFCPSFPIEASLTITNKCNYNCRYCYSEANDLIYPELNTGAWKRIIDKLADSGILKVYFGGGEPFLRPDIFELFEYCIKEKGLTVTTSTNASLLSKNCIKRINDTVAIQVSLDGTEVIHERLRGSYSRTMRGLKLLLNAGRAVTLATVVTRENVFSLKSLYDDIVNLDLKSWHVMRVQPAGRAWRFWDALSISNEEWASCVNWIRKLSRNNKDIQISIDGTFDIDKLLKIDPEDVWMHSCEGGREMCVLPNGDVIPCELRRSKEQVLGNAFDERNLKSFWQKYRSVKHNPKFWIDAEKIHGKCQRCIAFVMCRGGCRIIAERLTGDVLAPDPFCPHEPPSYAKCTQ